jgi:hypothetical protein
MVYRAHCSSYAGCALLDPLFYLSSITRFDLSISLHPSISLHLYLSIFHPDIHLSLYVPIYLSICIMCLSLHLGHSVRRAHCSSCAGCALLNALFLSIIYLLGSIDHRSISLSSSIHVSICPLIYPSISPSIDFLHLSYPSIHIHLSIYPDTLYPSIHLSIYPSSIFPSNHLSIDTSIHPICSTIYPPIHLYICYLSSISLYLSIYLSIYLSVCLSICLLSMHPSLYLAIELSIYLSIYLSLSIYRSIYTYIYIYIYISAPCVRRAHCSSCRFSYPDADIAAAAAGAS